MALKEYKILVALLGMVSVAVIGVCAWTIAAPITVQSLTQISVSLYDNAGHSPKIGIAAGIALLLTSISHFFGSLEKKQNLGVGVLFIFLSLVISIAAMGVAVSDISQLNQAIALFNLQITQPGVREVVRALAQVIVRLKVIAAVTGVASGFEIVALIMGGIILNSATHSAGAYQGREMKF